jgi:ligand-binding sensor domain-containing protein
MRSVLRDFSCSQDQRVTAVSEDGRFYWRVGELEWEFGQLSETGLYSMVTRDGTTYIAGESGTLFTRSQEETRQLHTPFSPLNDASEEDFHAQRVKDVWVSHDGSDAWLLDHQKLYRKTQEGWVHVPVGTPADPAGGPKQLWGIDDPELLTRNGAVYRWNGAVWEGTAENVLSPDESVVAIDGHSPSKMWVAESRGLARYDGETWIDVAAPGSTLEAELQSRDAEISDIDAAPDGTLLLAVGDDVLRLSGTTGDTQLEKAAESPCSGVDRVFQSEEGPLYVGTESGCVASRTDGTWQTRDISPRQVREFEPRPGNSLPLVVTDTGALKAMPDGSYTEAFRGETVAASAVPGIDAVVLAHTQGLLIKHY